MEYIILKDTRERKGWDFKPFNKCLGMEVIKLDTGDYTIKGYENLVCIERKGSIEEMAGNLGRKKIQFEAEIERMKSFEYKYIICEFSIKDLLAFPDGVHMSKEQREATRVNGKYMLKTLMEYQVKKKITVMFCGDATNAFMAADSIFKRICEVIDERNQCNGITG